MKMTELRAENEALKQQIALLSEQKEGDKDSAAITQLKDKNRTLKKSIKDLKAEIVVLSNKLQALANDKSTLEQDNQILKADLEHIQQQITELSDVHARTITEVESLRDDRQALQEKASHLPVLQTELDRLQQVETLCNQKSAQVDALQAELEQHRHYLAQARAEASRQLAEHQDQAAKLSTEMEQLRSRLTAELEAQREQSGAEIASLQAQKDGLSTKITDLTVKLKMVAMHLEKQLSEKRKITSQYETSLKEYQAFKVKAEKEFNDLMAMLQKMAAELDASRAAHPTQESQPGTLATDKPLNLFDPSAADKQRQKQLLELQNQISDLNGMNTSLNQELTALSNRMKRINHVLTTPRGRLFSRLLGLKG